MVKKSKSKKTRNKLTYVLLIIILVALVMTILELTNTTHFFHKSAVISAPGKPIINLPQKQTTIIKSPQTSENGIPQGSANDENGKVPSSQVPTNPSDWATSSSGQITLKLPVRNTTVQSGSTITGTAANNPVEYRLIDNQVGVIAQGKLNVVNDNFTATINFTHYSSTGQLDVFNTSSNGAEINEVQIPVNF